LIPQQRERRVSARLRVFFERMGRRLERMTENVSANGMFVCTDISAPVDCRFEIEIVNSKATGCLKFFVRVAHELSGVEACSLGRRPGMGLQLIDKDALSETIESMCGDGAAIAAALPRPVQVLIADGNPRFLDRLASALGEAGFAVEGVVDGLGASAVC